MIWILLVWATANVGFGLFLALVYRANQRGMSEPVPDVVAEEIARLEALGREECPYCRGPCKYHIIMPWPPRQPDMK